MNPLGDGGDYGKKLAPHLYLSIRFFYPLGLYEGDFFYRGHRYRFKNEIETINFLTPKERRMEL